jgi:hypothetical protein
MHTIEFDPEKQFSASDQERLKKAAKKRGMSPSEYIEATVKRALFAADQPKRRPSTK